MKNQPVLFRSTLATPDEQAAFALPSAIFLMVILAGLGVFLVFVSTHQQSGHAADLQGVRAYQAARAGVEWGAFNYLRNAAACPAAASFAPNVVPVPDGFTVTVNCVAGANDENNTAVVTARIAATACNQPAAGACPNPAPGVNYVERQISVVVGQ